MTYISVVFGWPFDSKPQEKKIPLTVQCLGQKRELMTFDSLDAAYAYVNGLQMAAAACSKIKLEVTAPVLYVPMGSSSMFQCTGCYDLRGHEHEMRHKKPCPNYKEVQTSAS